MELSDQELNQVSDVIAALTDDAEDEITSEDYRPEPARKQLAAV
nr:MAG TPA: hypothetical protein [Caudoviricetes sp.]